jgi:GT2 family glycosyltransferase
MPEPAVSVLIVTFNSEDDVVGCLDSLDAALPSRMHETIVVDNASADDSARLAAAMGAQTRVNEDNRGFAVAVNQAASTARGTWLVLLNPDARPAPGSLELLCDAAAGPVGAAGPAIVLPNGRHDPYEIRRDPRPRDVFLEQSGLDALLPLPSRYRMSDAARDQPRDVEALLGACLILTRTAWDDVGGMDESFFLYGEDIDLCRRLRDRGWRLRFVPGATVLHGRQQSARMVVERSIAWSAESMVRYFAHHEPDKSRLVRRLLMLGSALRIPLLLAAALGRTRRHDRMRQAAGHLRVVLGRFEAPA